MCLQVGLVLTGQDLSQVRQVIEAWAATTRRVRVDWEEPADQAAGAPERLAVQFGDRETGCACGLTTDPPTRGWRRSAMSDLSFLLRSLAEESVKSLRFAIRWEEESAELEQVELGLPQFRRLVKRGALGRNHLYSIACG